MSSEGSDIEMQSALPKVSNKTMPKSPSEDILSKKQEPKKITTKIMINQALTDLKSRKGVSLYAIKKYITEKYSVDTEKINYHIKKYIKTAVEEGLIVQTKGIGASGSFKLVPVKEKKKKVNKKVIEKVDKKEKKVKDPEKFKKSKEKKPMKTLEKSEKPAKTKTKEPKLTKPESKPKKLKKKTEKEGAPKTKKGAVEKGMKKKVTIAKGMQTPSKKKASMMKRKSIGSIIKPPKMKPKSKA